MIGLAYQNGYAFVSLEMANKGVNVAVLITELSVTEADASTPCDEILSTIWDNVTNTGTEL